MVIKASSSVNFKAYIKIRRKLTSILFAFQWYRKHWTEDANSAISRMLLTRAKIADAHFDKQHLATLICEKAVVIGNDDELSNTTAK